MNGEYMELNHEKRKVFHPSSFTRVFHERGTLTSCSLAEYLSEQPADHLL